MNVLRRALRWISPYHRGQSNGYARALEHVANGLQLSIEIAEHKSVDINQAVKEIAVAIQKGRQ